MNARPVDLVADALKGDVVDILRDQLSALGGMEREVAYDAVMNDPAILDSSFKLFRGRPELFEGVIIDTERKPPQGDDALLWCGRTLNDVIALILRASAKRYFRAKLKRPPPPAAPKIGMLKGVAIKLGLAEPPAAPKRPVSAAERLYGAIKDHLRFDWQAAMIPHYTPLSPRVVNDLGPRLLDIREPAQLRAITAVVEAQGWDAERPPLLLDGAQRLMRANSTDTIDADVLFKVCQQLDLARLFADAEDPSAALRRAVSRVAVTSPEAVQSMMPILGNDIRLFVTFLFVAYVKLGEVEYRQLVGLGATSRRMRRWMARLDGKPLPPPVFHTMREAFEEIIAAGNQEDDVALLNNAKAHARAQADKKKA